ncbi:phosphoesterase [Sinomonas cellulolyticus]|uniref:2'-5' RNA ligase family protein n=1 Tax=Sinomonas cellulolyticus TaxID=2801916 RepID=A0ABS1JZ67_9MICC|nr:MULTISPECIES: 2'-5' RNA ligase family protein [Sinomonas]MBL0704493.1 2'-5' RNA ligase family protein [Sinomonas cellulolyticus]GHG48993.1 phosphoesterase [Sinomonas sp. KCTC 49339]
MPLRDHGPFQRRPGASPGSPLVGVILSFPEAVAVELRAWRTSFGDPMAETIPAHITLVTTTETDDWDATARHVREVAAATAPFRVSLRGTGTFRPVSPVVFVNVAEGFDECVRLHRRLQRGPLERALPFPYHPHVTVAHDLPPEQLDAAQEALASYRQSFTVASMGLYEHDADGFWQLREELDFGARREAPRAGEQQQDR